MTKPSCATCFHVRKDKPRKVPGPDDTEIEITDHWCYRFPPKTYRVPYHNPQTGQTVEQVKSMFPVVAPNWMCGEYQEAPPLCEPEPAAAPAPKGKLARRRKVR